MDLTWKNRHRWLVFQQDGARYHKKNPPKSRDLIELDYVFWGFMKDKVYAVNSYYFKNEKLSRRIKYLPVLLKKTSRRDHILAVTIFTQKYS